MFFIIQPKRAMFSTKSPQVERGMIVVYDTFKRAWVDNCYPDLDEFWLCDELQPKQTEAISRLKAHKRQWCEMLEVTW